MEGEKRKDERGKEGGREGDRQTDILQQLQNGQHDVIDITESGGLTLLSMMEAPSPVDSNVRLLFVELHCSSWREGGKEGRSGGG